MKCRAIPYEGQEPYIFLSYCHKDADRVYPLLEQMVRDGYRVWYDDGNHPGDDWLENIAQHLNSSRVCLAMLSENASASHNCRNEVNFALECNKKLMAVLLEDFAMTLGMQLQLGTIHYLKRSDFSSDRMILQKLYETADMKACLGEPGKLLRGEIFKETEVKKDSEVKEKSENEKKVFDFVNSEKGSGIKTNIELLTDEEQKSDSKPETREERKQETKEERKQETKEEQKQENQEERKQESNAEQDLDDDDGATIYKKVNTTQTEEGEEEGRTVRAAHNQLMVLLRKSNSSGYVLNSVQTQIGRSKKCDIVLAGNPYIGKHHADIIQYEGRCYLWDTGSVNGTFVGEMQLEPESRVRLENRMTFRLYDEEFVFFCGTEAKQMAEAGKVYFICNPKTQCMKFLQKETLHLDRSHKWEDGTMSDQEISRSPHAAVTQRENGLYLEDKGHPNGVSLNGRSLEPNGIRELKTGDQIQLGTTILEAGIVTL